MHNRISEIRRQSRFENYKVLNQSQINARDAMFSLSDMLVNLKDVILKDQFPFPESNLVILHGQPGTGKTHLQEALINEVSDKAPELVENDKIFLFRGNFSHDYRSLDIDNHFETSPIIIVDDLYSNLPSEKAFTDFLDGGPLCNFIGKIHEKNNLVIVSSNYAPDALIRMGETYDKTGRLKSRLQGAFDYPIEGDDYRLQKTKTGFSLRK